MYGLVTGTLFRDPEEKTSKAGKTYAKATLKERVGDENVFATIMAFSGVNADPLMLAKDGDAVSAKRKPVSGVRSGSCGGSSA